MIPQLPVTVNENMIFPLAKKLDTDMGFRIQKIIFLIQSLTRSALRLRLQPSIIRRI